jgi:hypothetical protein
MYSAGEGVMVDGSSKHIHQQKTSAKDITVHWDHWLEMTQ